MTYNVFGVTLNLAQLNYSVCVCVLDVAQSINDDLLLL